MISLLRISTVLIGIAVPFSSIAAEKICSSQPEIIALSSFVLANRHRLPTLVNRQHGTIAAYLKLRYKPEGEDETLAMLNALVEQKVARAGDLALAWAIRQDGPEKALRQRDTAGTKAILINRASVSALRALVLAENREPLFAMLAAMPDAERLGVENAVAVAILDQSDAFKNTLAMQAEKQGFVGLAAGLAVTQSDPQAWAKFVAHIKNPPEIAELVQRWHWAPAYVGHAPLPQSEAKDESDVSKRSRIGLNLVMRAATVMPERDFLLSYVNQTFDLDGAAAASAAVLAEAKRHGPANPWSLQESWLLAYRSLLKASSDRRMVDESLSALLLDPSRSDSGSVRDRLDWMLAVEKLTPYVRGQSSDRGIPQEATPAFTTTTNWFRWREIADSVRAGDDLSRFRSDPYALDIATALLLAAGKPHDLASLVVTSEPNANNVLLAEDFAARMDRDCDGYLNTAAEALLLPGAPTFKF